MKVALVYDRINKWGGAERVLLTLHEIWPEAPLYTAVYDPKKAPWASVFDVHVSFLQYLPLAASHHELYPWLTPLAFETFSFDPYDLVISITSAEAKGIITKPHTLHICYCLTPTRYLWSGYEQYVSATARSFLTSVAKPALARLAPVLRRWDIIASTKPDYYIAVSQRVKQRIKAYYEKDTEAVIYPPVDLDKFKYQISNIKYQKEKQYFLLVSRLVSYKRVDIIIDAFNRLGWPLVVIGDGWERRSLERRAKENIRFVGQHLTDEELVGYYGNCRAFVFAGDEDFGLVAVEAQSCGKPVVAYRGSGISEIVKDKETGFLFDEQTPESLVAALKRVRQYRFDSEKCRENGKRFDKNLFKRRMKGVVERLYREYHTV